MIRAALALAFLAPIAPALAQVGPVQPAAAPLTLDEVLRSSARAAPQIVEALAKVRSAQGRALSVEGGVRHGVRGGGQVARARLL